MKSIAHPGAEPPPRARRQAVAPPAFISIIRTSRPRHPLDLRRDRVLGTSQRLHVRGGQFPARETFWRGRGPGRIKSNLRQPPDALRFGLQGLVERVPLPPVLRRGALAGDAGPLGRVVAGAAPRALSSAGGRAALHLSCGFWSLCSSVVAPAVLVAPARGALRPRFDATWGSLQCAGLGRLLRAIKAAQLSQIDQIDHDA